MISLIKDGESFNGYLSAIYRAKKDIKDAIGERYDMERYHSDSEMVDILSDFDSRPFYGIKINDLYEFDNGKLIEKKCDDPSQFKAFVIPDKYEPEDSIKDVRGMFYLNNALQYTDCISSISISLDALYGGFTQTFANCRHLTEATFNIKKWYLSQNYFTQKLSSYMFYGGKPSIFHDSILSSSTGVNPSLKNVLSCADGISSISFPQQSKSQIKFLFLETVDHNTDDPNYYNQEHRNYFGIKFERTSPLSVYCKDGMFLYSLDEYLAEMSDPSKTVATYPNEIRVAYDIDKNFKNDSINYVGYVENLRLGNAISSIEENAFGRGDMAAIEYNYANLKRIFFPESIKNIKRYSGLYHIGYQTPDFVPSLSTIDVESISSFLEVKDYNHIRKNWNLYHNGNEVKELVYTNGDLYNCSSLERLSTSVGQTKIVDHLYQYCPNLSSLTLTESITTIGTNTRSTLKEVNIPSISSWMNIDFSNAILNSSTKLLENGNIVTAVRIERNNVKPYTFANYSYLQEATANNLDKIGDYGFYNCSNLSGTYADAPGGGVYSNIFGGYKSPGETFEIEDHAFENCKKLLRFPSVCTTKVGYSAFKNAMLTSESNVDLDRLITIKANAFDGMKFRYLDSETNQNRITLHVSINPNDSQLPIREFYIGQDSFANMDQTTYLKFINDGTLVVDMLPYIKKIPEEEVGLSKRYSWGLPESNILTA